MNELGESYIPRAYRMQEQSFWILLNKIAPQLKSKNYPPLCSSKRHRNGARNGVIDSAAKLSIAIRYFAGGCPADIAVMHGISQSFVLPCVWEVVDAVNVCPEMKIDFPQDHAAQKRIAREFQLLNTAEFDNCVGCIGSMLVWIPKPNVKYCSQVGAQKLFCGRKMKFGLNMQAVCDAQRRFLDIDINHPGATSDYMVFMQSSLRHKLESEGFLVSGLALFGDNAYLNSPYMAAPFKRDSRGSEDAYNSFHSSTRINIDCAFGMLVHR